MAEKIVQTVEFTPDKNTRKSTVSENKMPQKATEDSAPLIIFDDDDDHGTTSSSLHQYAGESNDLNYKASTLLDASFQIGPIATLAPEKINESDTPLIDTQQMPSDQLNADANNSAPESSQMANVDNQHEAPQDCAVSLVPVKDRNSITATADISTTPAPVDITATPATIALAPPKNTKRLKKIKVSFDTI